MRFNDETNNLNIDDIVDDDFEDVEEIDEIEDIDEVEPEEDEVLIGVVSGCSKLNVRFMPNIESDIVCKIVNNTEVMIDESESTDEFYKVYISSGIEGYCMKKYIDVQP